MLIDKYIEILEQLVEIPSISSLDAYKENVVESASFVKGLFENLGLEASVASVDNGQPAVLAKTEVDPGRKTVLLYAHHDVQPVGDEEAWNTDPFNPEIINGRLYGRGSGDDKAGVLLHYAVVEELLSSLPVNIKIFIEGEEEIGSPTMEAFVIENRDELDADVIVIADSGNVKIGVPTVTTTRRGLVDGIIEVDIKSHNDVRGKTNVYAGGDIIKDKLLTEGILNFVLKNISSLIIIKLQ